MVQAQKVPLRPPPFLLQEDEQRHRREGDHERPDKDVKCHSLTEHRSNMLSEKGQLADFQDEYLNKLLIKIQELRLNQIRDV